LIGMGEDGATDQRGLDSRCRKEER
jgi:hypothetical protein